MKNVLVVPIIVSLTVIVLAVISQQVTMALYFLPLNNTLINQEGENMTNQTTTPLPTPSPVSNQTTISNNPSLLSYIDPTFKFKISYPSNLTKYGVLNLNLHKITNIGHKSLGEVAFGLPNSNKTFFVISIGRDSGNLLLKDYVTEETNMLSRYVGFKPLESSDISLGGNTAHKIVYVYGIVK